MMSNGDSAKKLTKESNFIAVEKKRDDEVATSKVKQQDQAPTTSLDDNQKNKNKESDRSNALQTNEQDSTKTNQQQEVLPPSVPSIGDNCTESSFASKNFEDMRPVPMRQTILDATRIAAFAKFSSVRNQGNAAVNSERSRMLANLLAAADNAANESDADDDDDWGAFWASSDRKRSESKPIRSFAALTKPSTDLTRKHSTGINHIRDSLRNELSRKKTSRDDDQEELGQTRKRQKCNNNASEVGDLIVRLSSSNLLNMAQSGGAKVSGGMNVPFGASRPTESSVSLDDWETGRKRHFGRRSRSGLLSEVVKGVTM
uniref:Uncharacterized protein n=1 Tax=Asterionellopsis glacialis TaxID=33640 RepID=A0A7S0KYD8_9STRA|mmetsp:Transcript_1272/g.1775  ORF Transcript_1272/g.1775 Transcript_1272/m.1775 type:complete len:316 (+) Transcript_1272:84-1031(+)